MGVASRSVEIDSSLGVRLQAEADSEGASVAEIAEAAISAYLDARESKRAAIFLALREGEERGYVEEAEVRAWMQTWDGGAEAPMPKARRKLDSRS